MSDTFQSEEFRKKAHDELAALHNSVVQKYEAFDWDSVVRGVHRRLNNHPLSKVIAEINESIPLWEFKFHPFPNYSDISTLYEAYQNHKRRLVELDKCLSRAPSEYEDGLFRAWTYLISQLPEGAGGGFISAPLLSVVPAEAIYQFLGKIHGDKFPRIKTTVMANYSDANQCIPKIFAEGSIEHLKVLLQETPFDKLTILKV